MSDVPQAPVTAAEGAPAPASVPAVPAGPAVDDTPEARAVAAERAAELAALRQVQGDLAAVDRALAAIDDGAYGTCAVCGSRLPDELLADSPVATACADHEHDHDGAAPAAL